MSAKNQVKALAVARKLGIDSENLIYIGEGLWTIIATITPEIATDWLQFNTGNRDLKDRNITKIVQDMQDDNWHFTHEGIAFGFDNELKDGQNRLNSVARSGATIKCLVFIGLDDNAKGVINQGTIRTPLDAAKFAGITTSKLAISSSKICEVGLLGNTKGISNSKAVALLEKHKEAFEFVQTNLLGTKPTKGVSVSAICAGIMRGFYACKDQPRKISRLKKFCTILHDGQYGKVDADVAAFRLRELAIKENWSGSQYSRELYKLTEEAITCFLNSTPVKRLRAGNDEKFPLPHEVVTPVAAPDAA